MKVKQADLGSVIKLGTGKLYTDDAVPNFFIRSGQKAFTFCIQYRIGRQQRRYTIGSSKIMSLNVARDLARDKLVEVARGHDPQGLKSAARRAPHGKTFADCIDAFLDDRKSGNRPATTRTIQQYSSYLHTHAKDLHRLGIADISTDHVWTLVDKTQDERTETVAGSLYRVLSAFFSWTIAKRLRTTNPVTGVARRKAPLPRTRVLTDGEIADVWAATSDASDWSKIVRLLLLTGQRRNQISALRWDEVDLVKGLLTFDPDRVKSQTKHVVPITVSVKHILEGISRRSSGLVFGEGKEGFKGFSKSQAQLLKRMPKDTAPWSAHDLRRTFTSGMNNMGNVNPWDVEAVLSHLPGGVRKHYDYSQNVAGKLAVLSKWDAHIRNLTGEGGADVVAFRVKA